MENHRSQVFKEADQIESNNEIMQITYLPVMKHINKLLHKRLSGKSVSGHQVQEHHAVVLVALLLSCSFMVSSAARFLEGYPLYPVVSELPHQADRSAVEGSATAGGIGGSGGDERLRGVGRRRWRGVSWRIWAKCRES
ncbi:hypothetical protein GUJ93_ZPchr0001g32993 [Zizania palustris]|uniref:Uncharacterized protein n=1 Tax=Zizania palustris TaxID=103762 RepID=A0A8J5V7N9_ZIZPA|nr:hypothetical protein GUJ93_ZPchr0001g32993 [Zizania palustris]